MSAVLRFKNSSYFDDDTERTIAGAQFRALMELCFAQADTFSLLRCGWPGAQDGTLEQELRPWLVGEYASYGILHWFDIQRREMCCLYRATPETKEILLRHIHHLFEAEQSLAPAGHQAYLEEKYAVYDRASEEAWDRFSAYMDAWGWEQSEEQQEAVLQGLYKQAREQCPDVFSERDHYSNMEDPCFFRGNEMFFKTVTHEQECWAQVLSPEFEAALRELGEWLDVSGKTPLPLFSLATAEGMKWY